MVITLGHEQDSLHHLGVFNPYEWVTQHKRVCSVGTIGMLPREDFHLTARWQRLGHQPPHIWKQRSQRGETLSEICWEDFVWAVVQNYWQLELHYGGRCFYPHKWWFHRTARFSELGWLTLALHVDFVAGHARSAFEHGSLLALELKVSPQEWRRHNLPLRWPYPTVSRDNETDHVHTESWEIRASATMDRLLSKAS